MICCLKGLDYDLHFSTWLNKLVFLVYLDFSLMMENGEPATLTLTELPLITLEISVTS